VIDILHHAAMRWSLELFVCVPFFSLSPCLSCNEYHIEIVEIEWNGREREKNGEAVEGG